MEQEKKVYSDIEMVDPSTIRPNEYNPNAMTDEQFEFLVDDFRKNGWIGQPVVINRDREIIDGFHRWKAATHLGFENIPVVVFEPRDGDHQKAVTIALNAKRGEMNPLKLAALVTELNRNYSVEELSTMLGYSIADLKDKLSMTRVTGDFMEKIRQESELRSMNALSVINFAVTPEQERVILEALGRLSGKNRGEKLFSLCDAYLKQE